MIYAICFDTNTLVTFQSERLAEAHIRSQPGCWQCFDEAGRVVRVAGTQATSMVGLLAAHQWLADHHDIVQWDAVWSHCDGSDACHVGVHHGPVGHF